MQLFRNLYGLFEFLLRHARGVRHARAIMAAVVVAGIVSGLANTVLIGVVNQAISAGPGRYGTLAWAFAGVCVLLPVSRYAAEYLLTVLSERATLELRTTLTSRIVDAPLRQLEEVGPSRVMTTLTGDIPTVTGAVTVLPTLCMNLAVVGGSLVYMALLSPVLLAAVMVFLVLGVLAYQLPVRRAQHHITGSRRRMDELYRHFRVVTDGIKELKLNHERRRELMEVQLRGTVGELARHGIATQRLFSGALSVAQALVFILIGLVAFVLPLYVQTAPAVLSGYTLAILYMVTPIQTLMNLTPQLARATTAMRRVEEMKLALPAPASAAPASLPVAAGWRRLEVDGATHAYRSERDGSSFTLGPIDLSFRPGEIVFVTGGNGSGKTTFAKLLTGLYTPESGGLRLDGEPVTGATLARYQGLFSVVFSDFFLFDTVLGGAGRSLDDDARHYLAELHLDHKVKVEEGRLSTTDLSQGQRKRLALLAAYLEDRPIYLFDEWAADQDPQFKHVFYHELLPRLRERGKTVFAITHDDRYFHVADRLIKLDSGQVVEDMRPGERMPGEGSLALAAGPAPAERGA